MPLAIPFTLQEVSNQFHINDRPTNMVTMANRIFGVAAGIRLSDFDGFGSPTAVLASVQNIEAFQADFRINVTDWGGITVKFWFTFWECDGTEIDPPQGATVYTTGNGFANSNGFHSLTVTHDLQPSTTYCLKVWYENEFNVNNPSQDSDASISFTTAANKYDPPALSVEPDSQFINLNEIHLEWTANAEPTSFGMRYRLSGSADPWTSGGTGATNKINWGTASNPKQGDWQLAEFWSQGDQIDVELNAQGPDKDTSDWSSFITLSL